MAGVFNKFVHPGTIKQGYLVKSPPLDKKLKLDGWRKRWCVFTIIEGDPSLDYYKDEEEAFSGLPIKRISLLNCYQVVSDMTHKQKKHIFALHLPKRVYYFSAPSHAEMLEWLDAFCTNLKLSHTDGGTMPGTPPISRFMLDNRSATLPAAHSLTTSSPSLLPRSRTPDSPLPPIPRSPDVTIRPPPPAFPIPPIPPTPLDISNNSYPNISPRTSPSRTRFILSSMGGKENGGLSEGAKVSISINPPPALPPHRRGAKSSSDDDDDDDDDEPLSPPTLPPRRCSPIPLSSPPSMPMAFEMDGDSPPAPPPRIVGGSPLHSVT